MPEDTKPKPVIAVSADGKGIDTTITTTVTKDQLNSRLTFLQSQMARLQTQIDDITAKLALIENK
jgi:hypothetical protein